MSGESSAANCLPHRRRTQSPRAFTPPRSPFPSSLPLRRHPRAMAGATCSSLFMSSRRSGQHEGSHGESDRTTDRRRGAATDGSPSTRRCCSSTRCSSGPQLHPERPGSTLSLWTPFFPQQIAKLSRLIHHNLVFLLALHHDVLLLMSQFVLLQWIDTRNGYTPSLGPRFVSFPVSVMVCKPKSVRASHIYEIYSSWLC